MRGCRIRLGSKRETPFDRSFSEHAGLVPHLSIQELEEKTPSGKISGKLKTYRELKFGRVSFCSGIQNLTHCLGCLLLECQSFWIKIPFRNRSHLKVSLTVNPPEPMRHYPIYRQSVGYLEA